MHHLLRLRSKWRKWIQDTTVTRIQVSRPAAHPSLGIPAGGGRNKSSSMSAQERDRERGAQKGTGRNKEHPTARRSAGKWRSQKRDTEPKRTAGSPGTRGSTRTNLPEKRSPPVTTNRVSHPLPAMKMGRVRSWWGPP